MVAKSKLTPAREAAPGKRPGRPTGYRPEYVEQARKLCMVFAATDEDLAEYFDVSLATVARWKVAYPEFRDTLKGAKQEADADVAVSLYKMATGGYSHPDMHICVVDGAVVQTPMTRHYPPSVTAQIFWLKNRQSKHWRDKVEVQQEVNHNVFPSAEVLDAIYAKSLAEAAEMEKELIGRRERLGITFENRENAEDT